MVSSIKKAGIFLSLVIYSSYSSGLVAYRVDLFSEVEFTSPEFSTDLGREFSNILFLNSASITETVSTPDSVTYFNAVPDVLRFASDDEASNLNGFTLVGQAISETTITNAEQDALQISVENLDTFTGVFWRIDWNVVFNSDSIFNSTDLTGFLNSEAILQGLENAAVNTLSLYNMSTGELASQGRVFGYSAVDRIPPIPSPGAGLLLGSAIFGLMSIHRLDHD